MEIEKVIGVLLGLGSVIVLLIGYVLVLLEEKERNYE